MLASRPGRLIRVLRLKCVHPLKLSGQFLNRRLRHRALRDVHAIELRESGVNGHGTPTGVYGRPGAPVDPQRLHDHRGDRRALLARPGLRGQPHVIGHPDVPERR